MRLGRRFGIGAEAHAERVQVDRTIRILAEIPALELRRVGAGIARVCEFPGVEHVRVRLVFDVVACAALQTRTLHRCQADTQVCVSVDGHAGVSGLAGGAVVGAIGDEERAVRQGEVGRGKIGGVSSRAVDAIFVRRESDHVPLQAGVGFLEPVINADVDGRAAWIGVDDALTQQLQRRVEVEFAGPGSGHALPRYWQRIGSEHRRHLIVLGSALRPHAENPYLFGQQVQIVVELLAVRRQRRAHGEDELVRALVQAKPKQGGRDDLVVRH